MHGKLKAELRRSIQCAAGCDRPHPEKRFHKDAEYLSYGLVTPDFRRIMKEFRPQFLRLPLKERLGLASELLSEHVGELGHAGIHVVGLSTGELQPSHFPVLNRLHEDFRDWSQVDHFCGVVVQPLLWKHRDVVLALLNEWNRSSNRWKRRSSVVAFTRKVAESGLFTGHALRLCENLLHDSEDIVRKGVGWALKDNLRSAPKPVLAFIKKARRERVSSTITLYAIRNLGKKARRSVLSL